MERDTVTRKLIAKIKIGTPCSVMYIVNGWRWLVLKLLVSGVGSRSGIP